MMNAAAGAVAKQLGLGQETVRRWVVQSQVDAGDREGRSSGELAEIKALKAKVRRPEEDNAILKQQQFSSRGSCAAQGFGGRF